MIILRELFSFKYITQFAIAFILWCSTHFIFSFFHIPFDWYKIVISGFIMAAINVYSTYKKHFKKINEI